MTDEFQKGLITGLAMQPLQVTTEHATPDPIQESTGFIHASRYVVFMINIFQVIEEAQE